MITVIAAANTCFLGLFVLFVQTQSSSSLLPASDPARITQRLQNQNQNQDQNQNQNQNLIQTQYLFFFF